MFNALLGGFVAWSLTAGALPGPWPVAMAYPAAEGGAAASAVRFLGVFAPTQLPLAAIEGILTVLVVMGLESCARPELREIGFLKEGLQ